MLRIRLKEHFVDFLWISLSVIPKNTASFLTGVLARVSLPSSIQIWLNRLFVRAFRIDLNESFHSVEEFASIEEIFTRRLRLGLRRPCGHVCSPADGRLFASGPITSTTCVQAKGITYSLTSLVFGDSSCDEGDFKPRWLAGIYLAPNNYHRVHSPLNGQLRGIRYIPGSLWPVNSHALQRVASLFTTNERLVFEIESPSHGMVFVIMVGALNVGRITTHFWPEFVGNVLGGLAKKAIQFKPINPPKSLQQGAELGVFSLGSTVIVLFSDAGNEGSCLAKLSNPRSIRVGDSLTQTSEN